MPTFSARPSLFSQPVKDTQRRLRDIGDALTELEEALAGPRPEETEINSVVQGGGWRQALPLAVAASLIVALVTGFSTWFFLPREESAQTGQTTFSIPSPKGVPVIPWISPDGGTIAFTGWGEGSPEVFTRSLDRLETVSLPDVGSAFVTGFSPDGEWLVVSERGDDGVLKRVPLAGGLAVPIADVASRSADWGPDDTIVRGGRDGLWLVPAFGRESTRLTTVTEGEVSHFFPQWVPNGRAVLFEIWTGDRETAQVAV